MTRGVAVGEASREQSLVAAAPKPLPARRGWAVLGVISRHLCLHEAKQLFTVRGAHHVQSRITLAHSPLRITSNAAS